jgi:hypothetical protein
MAKMFPPVFGDDHGSRAERVMFEALAKELPDTFRCYHSKQTLIMGRHSLQEGEIDFVILHPQYGLLTLEVKGGGISRNEQGSWFHLHRDGSRTPMKKDPFDQVSGNMHRLTRLLIKRLGGVLPEWGRLLKIPFGYAVALPDISAEGNIVLPSNADPALLLDGRSLAQLQKAVSDAMKSWSKGRQPISEREYNRFVKHVFHPALQLAPTLASTLASENATMVRLTEHQMQILETCEDLPRARVDGPPGAGKTLVAVEKARRFAAEGKRVCVLCFNRPLSRRIAELLASPDDDKLEITVSTYHQLCRLAADKLKRSFDVPKDKETIAEFWNDTAPDILFEAIDQGLLQFDAVVIDEAQDMHSHWWLTIESLVPLGGPMWAFYDAAQDIYGREADMPVDLLPLKLQANCRSTRALRELCDKIVDRKSQSPESVLPGEPHEEIPYKSADDLKTILESRIGDLREKGKLKAHQIVILSPHTQPNSSLAELTHVAKLPLVHTRAEKGILFSTVPRFKGLEADVVILIDQDPEDPMCNTVHRYVAASRAKHRLIVFCKNQWLPA